MERAGLMRAADCTWIENPAALPSFEPALADDAPATVASFQGQLGAVDGLVIAAPEYAAGLAGSTKNALD